MDQDERLARTARTLDEGARDNPGALGSAPAHVPPTRLEVTVDETDLSSASAAIARLALPAAVEQALAGDVARCLAERQPVRARCEYISDSGERIAVRYHVCRVEPSSGPGSTVSITVEQEGPGSTAPGIAMPASIAAQLLDLSNMLVYVKDLSGRYTYVNERLSALYGLPSDQVLGRTDHDLFEPSIADRLWAAEQHVLEAEAPLQIEESLPAGGRARLYLSSKFALQDASGLPAGVCSISTDITERATADTTLSRSADRLMALNTCFLSFGPDPEENMRQLTSLSKDLLGGSFAMYQRAGRGMISSMGIWSAASESAGGGQLCDALYAQGGDEVLVTRRLQESPFRYSDPNVAQYGLQTHVGRLVRLGERVLGAVCVAYQEDVEPTEEDKRLLGMVASALAAEERRLRAEERQAVAYGIADAASRSAGLRELGGYIHQELQRLVEARNFYLALDDPVSKQIVFPYYVDETLPPGSERPGRPYDEGLTEYVLRSGKAMLLHEDDIRALVRKGTVRVIGTLPRVWLGVPLMDGTDTVGMMAVQSYSFAQAYDEEDLDFMAFVSGQVATAIKGKRSSDRLLESEQRYRLLAEHVSDIIWARDPNLRLSYISASVERVLGFSVAEALAQSIDQSLTPSSARLLRTALEEVTDAPPAPEEHRTLELEHYRKDGSTIWAEVKMTLLRDAGGRIQRVLGVTRDITERRELERQFRQINKMESLGQLAGGIAHHFNNLLTVINGYSQFMIGALEEDDPVRRDAESILKAGRRAADLTRQLLDFSRRRVLNPDVVDLNDLLPQTADMLRNVIGDNIRLTLDLAEGVPCVRIDPGQIEQVVLNLAVNSRDAMPEGGVLTLSTRPVEAEELHSAERNGALAARYVRLSVVDTGCGMAQEVRDHLFEPFYTTKEVGEGTGLGLATVYGIVTQAGGHITVDTAEGAGTAFHVFLPAVADTPRPEAAPEPSEAAPGGREVILVLEDEQDVRELAVRMLDRLGYTVLAAASGTAGLQLARGSDRPIDLILSDVMLPETRAVDFVRDVRRAHPRVKVLYMSGYSDGSVLSQEVEEARAPFIGKPFTLLKLAQKVRQVLDSD